jgi:hypothetical protein
MGALKSPADAGLHPEPHPEPHASGARAAGEPDHESDRDSDRDSDRQSDRESEADRSFGVFKPVGHVLMSFPTAAQASACAVAVEAAGLLRGEHALRRWTDREMLEQIEADLRHASPIAAIGQELNLVVSHRALAERGYHWLAAKVQDDEHAAAVAALAERHGAERAQHYGRFIIEELIEHPSDLPQVAESPDRGLDAQTPSGEEAERADLRSHLHPHGGR